MSNSNGALPNNTIEYEIMNKKAIIIGLISLFAILIFCYHYFYLIPLFEESEKLKEEIIKEVDCNNRFEYFKNHEEMNQADRDWAFRVIENECRIKP